MASSPRILKRQTGTVQTLKLCKKARVAGHHRSACSGVKACPGEGRGRCETQATLGGQAAKLCYRFGPLTPSARSANLIAGDGTKNGLSRSEQRTATNPKPLLD